MDRSKRVSLIGAVALTAVIFVALWSLRVPVHAQNAPATAVQFIGEAPPPEGAMTLWYRQPASDHPYTPPVGGRGGDPVRPNGSGLSRLAMADWARWCSVAW